MAYEWTEERLRYWNKTLKLYGLEPTELNELRTRLIVAQGYRCALCNRYLGKVGGLPGRRMYLDHDHHTGAIRGILCFDCNRYKVAKNSTQSALEIVRYLNDPPAHKHLEAWGVVPAHARAPAPARA